MSQILEPSISAILAQTDESDIVKIAVIGGLIVGGILIYTLIEVIGRADRIKQTEQTRREIAAYVAEGSMTPETAEKLLTAGMPNDWAQHVATMVKEGAIDTGDAERLLKAGPKSGPVPSQAAPARV